MKKELSIGDCFGLNLIINNIIEQQLSISANIAYYFYILNKKLNEIESFVFERIERVFGENIDLTKLNDEQKIIFETILNSRIIIDLPDIQIDDFLINELKLKIDDFNFLKYIYEK